MQHQKPSNEILTVVSTMIKMKNWCGYTDVSSKLVTVENTWKVIA